MGRFLSFQQALSIFLSIFVAFSATGNTYFNHDVNADIERESALCICTFQMLFFLFCILFPYSDHLLSVKCIYDNG